MEKVTKNLKIGNLPFSLKVAEDEIHIYEKAEKRANNILTEVREKHAKVSSDFQFGMVILQLALDLEASLEKAKENEQYAADVADSIDSFLTGLGKNDK